MPVEVPAEKLVPGQTVIQIAFTQGEGESEELIFCYGVYESHDESQISFDTGKQHISHLNLPLNRIKNIGVMRPREMASLLNQDAFGSLLCEKSPELQERLASM